MSTNPTKKTLCTLPESCTPFSQQETEERQPIQDSGQLVRGSCHVQPDFCGRHAALRPLQHSRMQGKLHDNYLTFYI
jgi:hypothetical protein